MNLPVADYQKLAVESYRSQRYDRHHSSHCGYKNGIFGHTDTESSNAYVESRPYLGTFLVPSNLDDVILS